MDSVVFVIMAGGAGTRFWPLSTSKCPKQFLQIFDNRSLLQMSYDHIISLSSPERVLVMTGKGLIPLVRKQLPDIPPENLFEEPYRRDTAAAVTLAAMICRARYGNPVMVVLTADHYIDPPELFRKHILSGIHAAEKTDVLFTFGITPSFPATGYGYLERGQQIMDDDGIVHYAVKQFHEKPDHATARTYVNSGNFYWNSGMFVWQTVVITEELKKYLPDHVKALEIAVQFDKTSEWEKALEKGFGSLARISIDVGVMERAENVRCVESTFSWYDVGGWRALSAHVPADKHGNRTKGRVLTLDATGNFVYSEDDEETVAIIGVSDLVVVRIGPRTLIVPYDRTEDIKKLVEQYLTED